LCVAAFDFAARTEGHRLDREKRRALSCLLDLGALINDHFDQHRFCKRSYRGLRKQLAANETARNAYRAYFRQLRQAERSRLRLRFPCREDILKNVADYRENVVRLSLSALAAIAFDRPCTLNSCPHLFALVMLIQICDDLLDWRKDWRAGLPTFVTAELLLEAGQRKEDGAESRQARKNIKTAAAAYLAASPRRRCAFWPLVSCTHAAFFMVKLLCGLVPRAHLQQEAMSKAGLRGLSQLRNSNAFSLED
jgi:hypothetical protein